MSNEVDIVKLAAAMKKAESENQGFSKGKINSLKNKSMEMAL